MGNKEIAKLGYDGTFADLKLIDKKLGLPRGTSFEMGGYSDYFTFEEIGEDWSIKGIKEHFFSISTLFLI